MWRRAQGILFVYVMYYVTQSAFYEHIAVIVDVLEWAKVITMCRSSRKYLGKTDVTSRALCSMLRILGTLQQTFLNKKTLLMVIHGHTDFTHTMLILEIYVL